MPHSPVQDESSCLLIAEAGKLISDWSFKVTENYILILNSFHSAHFYSLISWKAKECLESDCWNSDSTLSVSPLFYMYKKPVTIPIIWYTSTTWQYMYPIKRLYDEFSEIIN